MAKEEKNQMKEEKASPAPSEHKKQFRQEVKNYEKIVRILQHDIPGEKQLYPGLTRIKGVSWSFSNALCTKLKLDKRRKIVSLTEEEIKKIENFISKPELPNFLLNRRRDLETGEDMHMQGTDLDMKKDFDIKRLKKIKSYKGLRHALGQPVRGQRTRAHFRKKGKSVGVLKKAKGK